MTMIPTQRTASLFIWLTMLVSMIGFSSCNAVYDDLDPCPSGAEMRFIFEYNMEKANSFHKQVDCLTLYIYDSEGHLMSTYTETSDVLADEDWRLKLDLEPGHYTAVAYGGMACDEASFAHTSGTPQPGDHVSSLEVTLPSASTSKLRLHDLYFGRIEFDIQPDSYDYQRVTMPLIRDTNHFRIMLQHLNNEPLDGRDFDFEITADNSRLGHDNLPVASGQTLYTPWTFGSVSTDDDFMRSRATVENVTNAFAELSTSRLINGENVRLRIKSHKTGLTVADLPLLKYLLMLKSEGYNSMGNQEFLDRQRDWQLIFFLDRNLNWVQMHIVVADWTVRINNINAPL